MLTLQAAITETENAKIDILAATAEPNENGTAIAAPLDETHAATTTIASAAEIGMAMMIAVVEEAETDATTTSLVKRLAASRLLRPRSASQPQI